MIQISWCDKIAQIPKAEWDTLAQPLKTPFLEWEWLNNLETSGSVKPRNGWQPCHLIIQRNKELIAAAPLYLKGHSYGEFVFDHQWADLSYRLGREYYPKMLGMTPFTPAEGYRFLISPEENEREITKIMVKEIDNFCEGNQISSCNLLFVDPDWKEIMLDWGYNPWLHHSYIWSNKNFGTFDDYLKIFKTNQRRNIKRERKAVVKSGLKLAVLTGNDIPQDLFPFIYRFYSNTCDKFWGGSKYLTRQFFTQLYPNYQQRVILVVAYEEGGDIKSPVGMSFLLRKGDRLYGRYWGSLEEYNCLHFEACYYKPIEFSIKENIQIFDPGAGGSHKRRRGFTATGNYSLHRFYDSRMSQILRTYIGRINEAEQEEIDVINNDLPFSKAQIELPV